MADRKRLPDGPIAPALFFGGAHVSVPQIPDQGISGRTVGTLERGYRPTPENRLKYLYRIMWVDPDVRRSILDIRDMDRLDTRVKKIHSRMARAATKGGLILHCAAGEKLLPRRFKEFVNRLGLKKQEKLESDMRGLVMEGNLPLQWVLDQEQQQVVAGLRMPSDTILPNVDQNGRFKSATDAYYQYDVATGAKLATFSLWQLSLGRLTPDNYDDAGSMGRPYLDAARPVWKKLIMTEEDLVIRRRERAPLRTHHVLEGATKEELEEYQLKIEDNQKEITTNYYSNKRGTVTAVQGDTNLDQIADVVHLLDTFFAGAPAPKGLFGYADALNRDILEDLKKDYFDELDSLQDTLSDVYEQGFRLELLLSGINPDAYEFEVQFAERLTDSANQRADLALKYKAIGAGNRLAWKTAGLEVEEVLLSRQEELDSTDPYPSLDEASAGGAPNVSVTAGNRRKGESSTDIRTRTTQ
jgi:hypothetical protein